MVGLQEVLSQDCGARPRTLRRPLFLTFRRSALLSRRLCVRRLAGRCATCRQAQPITLGNHDSTKPASWMPLPGGAHSLWKAPASVGMLWKASASHVEPEVDTQGPRCVFSRCLL